MAHVAEQLGFTTMSLYRTSAARRTTAADGNARAQGARARADRGMMARHEFGEVGHASRGR